MAKSKWLARKTRRTFLVVLALSFIATLALIIQLSRRTTRREIRSGILPVPERRNLAPEWNETVRSTEISQNFTQYFISRHVLLPSRQVPLSNETRHRMLHDYFASKRRVYLPASRRTTSPEFFVHPVDKPVLPETDFSSFTPLLNVGDRALLCYTAGTNLTASLQHHRCVCAPRWTGCHCSIPALVVSSAVNDTLRAHPRRVVYAFGLNHEIEHVLTTFSLLWDVVDLFVVGEMNITQYGDPRPRFILQLLKAGVFERFESKIFYIPCHFPQPKRCLEHDSYLCDDFKYECLEQHGIRSIANLRPDDLVMYTDVDELVPPELVHALKYHESSYRHFAVNMNWFVYGCAWRTQQGSHIIQFGATADFVKTHSLLTLRGRRGKPEPVVVMNSRPAGLHCSWCFDVAGIQLKLISAVNSDLPRWGDYAAMVEADFIEFLISRGTFFNLQDLLIPVKWSSLEGEAFRDATHCTRLVFDPVP